MLYQDRSGYIMLGLIGHFRVGYLRLCHVRPGYVRLGQVKTGYASLGQVMPGYVSLIHFSSD
jgi:hypothetical protein